MAGWRSFASHKESEKEILSGGKGQDRKNSRQAGFSELHLDRLSIQRTHKLIDNRLIEGVSMIAKPRVFMLLIRIGDSTQKVLQSCMCVLPGILVGTLGVAGYRDAIDQVRRLAQAAGKKTYTLLMGKPSPAKLANFPEVEIFVHISDPQVIYLS